MRITDRFDIGLSDVLQGRHRQTAGRACSRSRRLPVSPQKQSTGREISRCGRSLQLRGLDDIAGKIPFMALGGE